MSNKTVAQLMAEIEAMRVENEALKASGKRKLTLKVSEKGAASLYGIRRFPITFYREEWETILGMADEIRTFVTTNLKVRS